MLDLSKVEFSRNDTKRSIKIPNKLTGELAEDVGFHIGDGYMKRRVEKGPVHYGVHYDFAYAGNYPDDLQYFENVLIPRKRRLFNFDGMLIKNPEPNSIVLKLQSKAVFLFYRDILRVKESPKIDIEIPKWVFNSLELQKSVLRGLIDSDGCFRLVKNGYPMIDFQVQSKKIIVGIECILKNLEISYSSFKVQQIDKRNGKLSTKFRIQISGKKNVSRWMELVGFNNPKHIKKYNNWRMGQVGIEPTIST